MKMFPKQRLPFKEKVKDDFEWAKRVIDTLVLFDMPANNIVNYVSNEYNRKLSNYQLYNNMINQADFERECNPMGIDVGQFKDAIQPYNKTYNKINVLLGEEYRRPFNYKVILTNSEGVKTKLSHRDALIRNYVYSIIEKTIKEALPAYPQKLVEEGLQVIDPKDIDKYMRTSYLEAREITASKIMSFLESYLSIKEVKQDAFKHALIAGEEIVYVGTNGENPTCEVLNPLGVFYNKSSDTKFIQYGMYAGYRSYMSAADILDKYSDYLTEEQIAKIEERQDISGSSYVNTQMTYPKNPADNYINTIPVNGQYGESHADNWLVQHVEWRSEKKVGFIKFINEHGEVEEDIVSEDFKIPSTAHKKTVVKPFNKKCVYYYWNDPMGNPYSLEWKWIPEVWEGTKIGHDIYVKIGPKQVQLRSSQDPSKVKLGYHGVVYSNTNAEPISLMDRMKPFQYLYFIIMHKLKRLIAQDKGRIFHFDATMVDPKLGWEKTMYYLNELNIDIYNPLQNADQPGQAQRGKVTTATDWSNTQYIINYVNLLNAIDQQISDTAGVTKQREGQVLPEEAVGNAQASIQMSSIITDIYFSLHDKLWQEILTSLIEVTRISWKKKSIIKQYVLEDMSIASIELSPDDLVDAEFGVFVSSSSKAQNLFDSLKAIAQPLIQSNKAKFSDLIKIYKANSIEELEKEIVTSEENTEKLQQQMQAQQIEAQKQLQQEAQQFELEKQARQHAHEIAKAEIESFKFINDQDINKNKIPDQLEVEKFTTDRQLRKEELEFEKQKHKDLMEQKEKDRAILSKKNK